MAIESDVTSKLIVTKLRSIFLNGLEIDLIAYVKACSLK